MRIIIHVGADKTGSTALQRKMHASKDLLLNQRIHYSIDGSRVHNDRGLLSCFCTDRTVFPEFSGLDNKLNEYIANLTIKLKSMEQDETLVLSHEGIMGLPKDDLLRMKLFLTDYCDDIKIILYARDVYSYAVSAKSQRAKTGRLSSMFKPPYIKYSMIIEKLMAVFGNDDVEIRKYSSDKSFNIIDDFFSSKWFSGEPVPELRTPNNYYKNPSLNGLSYLVANNISNMLAEKITVSEFRKVFVNSLDAISGERLKLNFIERAVLDKYAAEEMSFLKGFGVVLVNNNEKAGMVSTFESSLKSLFLGFRIVKNTGMNIKATSMICLLFKSALRDFLLLPCVLWCMIKKK